MLFDGMPSVSFLSFACSPPKVKPPSITIYPFTLFYLPVPPSPLLITLLLSVSMTFIDFCFVLLFGLVLSLFYSEFSCKKQKVSASLASHIGLYLRGWWDKMLECGHVLKNSVL